jgi:hypothetical protein
MLRGKERLQQTVKYDVWVSTPDELARAVDAVFRRVLPDGQFEAEVEFGDGGPTATDDPLGLGEIPPHAKVSKIDISLRNWESSDAYRLVAMTFVQFYPVSVRVYGRTEVEATAMLSTIRQIFHPYVTGRRPWRTSPFLRIMLGWLAGGFVALGTYLLAKTFAETKYAVLIGTAVWLPLPYLGARISMWLFPPFELHDGKTRLRRFGWHAMALVLIPVVLGVVVSLLPG